MEHVQGVFQGADGLELFFQGWRPAGEVKACLAIVHGYGEHSGRYMNVVNQLVPLNYAVYGFDHRGHGRSPGKRGHINDWSEFRQDVQSFLKLVQEREPGRPLFLMGHSMGGLIVLEYALHYPDGLAGVVASGPALAQAGVSPLLMTLSRILSVILPGLTINSGLDAEGVSRDPAVVAAYRQDPLVHSLGTPRLATEMSKAMAWTQSHAGEWQKPILIIHGGADQLVPPAASQQFFEHVPIADKQRLEIPSGYHEPHNDSTCAQATSELARWLDAHLN